MKEFRIILLLFFALIAFSTVAQKKQGVKKEGAHEAEYNAVQQDSDAQDDSDEGQGNSENQSDPDQVANTSGTDTKVTSSSGSPAVEDETEALDGTNTMQRASLNIAGSPLPGRTSAVADSEKENKSNGQPSVDREIRKDKKKK
jgi:hypothetical protein